MPTTLYGLVSSSSQRVPDQPALLNASGEIISYAALQREIDGFCKRLRELGIGRQDRVAIVLPNGMGMAVSFLGIAAAATAAPLNPNYRASEFDFYLQDLRPKALLVAAGVPSPARESAAALNIPLLELAGPTTDEGVRFQITGTTPHSPVSGQTEDDDVALILHTSGTTSRPKMVPLTQRNLSVSAGHIKKTLQLQGADRCLNVMPLFHIHGLMAALLASVSAGASVVCTPGFNIVKFYRWFDTFRPTWYTAVPTMHQTILGRAAEHRREIKAGQLRFIRSSSASLPPKVMAELEETFDAPVIESYGMTEAAHQMASNPLPPAQRKAGTVGLPAGPAVAIMHEEENELLAAGNSGEIVIQGPNITAGYLENLEANQQSFCDGWFRTGDQGFFDDAGYLTITGRLKEIINRGGEKIAPREIDESLLTHPAVVQAVAFAIPDKRLGEEVAAAVVIKPDQMVTSGELQHHVAANLADFKVPRRVIFLDEIPKGPTGKLQRLSLAAQLGLDSVAAARIMQLDDSERADPEIESFIQGQWTQLFDLPYVALNTPFLDLGGDSIQAIRLINRLNDLIGINMTIIDFFDAPTIAHQAIVVEKKLLAIFDEEASGNDASYSQGA